MGTTYSLPLDSRSAGLRSARPEILRAASERWAIADGTPEGVDQLLRTAREMFVHAAFLYDLFTSSSVWALFAVEAALRDRLESEATFGRLVREARARGLVRSSEADRIEAGAKLRNALAHPRQPIATTPGMAEMMVGGSHEVVAHLYQDLRLGSSDG